MTERRKLWCIPAYAAFPVQVVSAWPRNPACDEALRTAFMHVRWEVWHRRVAGPQWEGYG